MSGSSKVLNIDEAYNVNDKVINIPAYPSLLVSDLLQEQVEYQYAPVH
jgi:hypothetical protein